MLYFTSDLHLGHKNAIEFTNRPFKDVDEMNEKLIQNINDTVGLKDELWILGDFSLKLTKEEAQLFRKRIKCKHVLLVNGNHDKNYSDDKTFESVQDYKEIKTKYGKLILFHYPIYEWNRAHYGSIHLHGHIHSTGEYNLKNSKTKFNDYFPHYHDSKYDNLTLRMYDVGVDANNFKPVSIDEIASFFNILPIKPE